MNLKKYFTDRKAIAWWAKLYCKADEDILIGLNLIKKRSKRPNAGYYKIAAETVDRIKKNWACNLLKVPKERKK